MALRKDLRVLVVDDMSVSRQILLQMLEQIGVNSVLTAPEGASAISSLAQFPADLVICDMNMPGMDGLTLLRHLRDDRRSNNIGFVMTSGVEDAEKMQDAWHAGMDQFLEKPFDMAKLITCVESIAGRI